ncbi:MAG: putative bifunctional diguanylate cyclase/phosphodiesterase [Solirubrobacteraceae bacterium]
MLLVLLVVASAVLTANSARQQRTANAEQAARRQTQFIATAILGHDLQAGDLRAPVTPARRRVLDRLFRAQLLTGGNLRATIYNGHGRVTYSTDRSLIGRVFPGAASAAVTQDAVANGSTTPAAPSSAQRGAHVLGTYAPLRLAPRGPAAVLELDGTYSSLSGGGPGVLTPLTVTLGAALLGLVLFRVWRPGPIRRPKAHLERINYLEQRAFHDALTGLPNRVMFVDKLEEALIVARRERQTLAVMLMDLDRFKEINDTFGHQCGDQMLSEVGQHLCKALRSRDTVARLGGDEFAVLAPIIAGELGAVALAERAAHEVRRTHTVAGVEVDVDASIGIALFPLHGDNVDELLRCADVAMYASKARGVPTVYAVEHDHHSADRLALGAQLRRAIEQGEIVVHYQPKADFATGEITGVEALVRWEHHERGLLGPDLFIPLAEQTGLIRALTTHVLNSALEQCKHWRDRGRMLSVAVNITGRDLLDQRFAEEVKDLLLKWNVPPESLELEITENTVLTDPTRASSILGTLGELGVRLAIDDFGSGNSSLGYLKRLPINVLKIDKSFVLQMHKNDDDAAIVRSTIDLGHNLGLKVVAEGVSSVSAWNRLRLLGCDVAQGYYLGKPVSGAAISRLLAEENHPGSIPLRRPVRDSADIA